ncbi:hypothetical protein [Glycomyces paridis]|uniref:Uncharacterized protein n=1 Tax=Glycomyces paridis TaxID=2126555 RepID=A0A4S8PKM3_9ACTN|nr:hypothetical protein [Glycomyces paridis]THV30122.1 hypothetical protein E9998_07015 [Glycomyces paridis]
MNRVLRIVFSRYGMIVIILVLVLGVIALAQTREELPLDGSDAGSSGVDGEATSEAFTEDDGLATEACDGEDCYTDAELPQEALNRASAFAEAWLNPYGYGPDGWHDSIAPFLTSDTADLMEGVDPSTVPAEERTGEPTASGSKVAIPMDTGTLTLTMHEGANDWTSNGWLVSAIDWEQL